MSYRETRPQLRTNAARSDLMRKVRQAHTAPEVGVATLCRQVGLRYRRNVKTLQGSPDFANKSCKWAIFVHGCFWHHHEGCSRATIPKRNRPFWMDKFATNRVRDERNEAVLRVKGYKVIVIWECELKPPDLLQRRLIALKSTRKGSQAEARRR